MVTTGYLERDAVVGGLKLHYQEWGNESLPAVLMLHGFGVSGHMFDEFAERMQDQHHLIALDQRGHGDSDWSEEGDYSRDAFVGDIGGFADALGLDRFILVGHSMGGLNAVTYTVQNPHRVRALVLIDVGPESAKEGVENIVRFTRGPDELEFEEFVELAHRFNQRRSLENIRERMSHRLKPAGDGKWTWKFDKRFRQDRDSLKVGSPLSNDEMWQLFRSVTVPTLLVRGAESDVLSADVAERASREMPRTQLAVVSGAGHSVPGDNPDEFTQVVREFLADVESARFEPLAAAEPPPLAQVVAEDEAARRRGASLAALVLLGAGLVVAGGAAVFVAKRQRAKRKKTTITGRAKAAAQRPSDAIQQIDVAEARKQAARIVNELAGVGAAGVGRARQTLDSVDIEGARVSALQLLAALGGRTKAAPAAAKSAPAAVKRVDTRGVAKRGASTASRAMTLASRTLPVLLAMASAGQRRRRARRRRVMRWRS